jgi:hypothetical protein
MSLEAIAAGGAIALAPWIALAWTAITEGRRGPVATGTLGVVWFLAAAALAGWLDGPASISLGDWLVLPDALRVAAPVAWAIQPEAAWGIAASGLCLWWSSLSRGEMSGASEWLRLHALCGIAAQVWLLDNVWWLLAAQTALGGLCALALRPGGCHGHAVRRVAVPDCDGHGHVPDGVTLAPESALWLASLWADAVFVLAALAAALSVRSLQWTELAEPDRLAQIQAEYPGMVELVGLLCWLAVCGRLFLFPFGAVRDAAAHSSPRANIAVWGLALLPMATRWLLAGRCWWAASTATTDLVTGWSLLAALVAAWCALASADLRVRVAWLLGAQVACTVEPLVRSTAEGATLFVVVQWAIALCAAAWLFVALEDCGDENAATSSASPRGSLMRTFAVWLAAAELTGVAVWPLLIGADPSLGTAALQIGVCGLAGLATVQLAADARTASAPHRWGFMLLIVAPPALALFFGGARAVGVISAERTFGIGLPATLVGMAGGLIWQFAPRGWRRGLEPVLRPFARLGRDRFSMPRVFDLAIRRPLAALASVCQLLEGRGTESLWAGSRGVHHATDEDLPSAGAAFYALSLWLAAAAVVATVMWLAR